MNRHATLKTAALGLSLTAATLAPAQEGGDLAGLLEATAPSIVTVKVVLEMEMSMMGQVQSEESRAELQGVVVDKSGLIMISNSEISSDRLKQAMGAGGGAMMGQMDIDMTPIDFKVVLGAEEEEHQAFLVAKDTKLDLAFLQVEEADESSLHPIDFSESAKPKIGDEVVAISRLGKGFDYAPHFTTAKVSGAIRKPRKAWIVDGTIGSFGLPIFAPDGDVFGVLITLAPSTTDDTAGGSIGGIVRMLSGGGMETGLGTFILPGKIVNGLIEQAREKANEMMTES